MVLPYAATVRGDVYAYHTAPPSLVVRRESPESHIRAGLTINCPNCNFIALVAVDVGKYTNCCSGNT
jgi:hypothetical protein